MVVLAPARCLSGMPSSRAEEGKEGFFIGFNKYLVYERSILKSMSSGLRPLEGTALKFSGLCLIQFLGGFVLVTDTNLTLPD